MAVSELHIGTVASRETPRKEAALISWLSGLLPVTTGDKVSFFRLLATMINAGISIVKALRILEDQTENPHFKAIIADIASRIESGSRFSEALQAHERHFSAAQIGMVESGEASGRLNQTLLQIALDTEKSAALTSRVRGAMIYPAVVLLIMLAAGFAVMNFVIPRIKEMFESLGGQLPAMTRTLIAISDFTVGTSAGLPNALWILLVLAALVFGFLSWKRTASGRFAWAWFVLQLPVFGDLSRKAALARFCRGLSTLVSSGVSIIKALRITALSVGNAVYEKRINAIADDVRQGITMGDNMKDDKKHFPGMVVGMISVAEQTAQIDTITEKIAEFYEDEVDGMVKNLSSLLEPLIIVVLGLAVGFLVISVMLPILESSDLAASGA